MQVVRKLGTYVEGTIKEDAHLAKHVDMFTNAQFAISMDMGQAFADVERELTVRLKPQNPKKTTKLFNKKHRVLQGTNEPNPAEGEPN